eukprot:Skav224621  [mRNA]  locus=scaffold2059:82349:90869:- [translate_table: standard]
MFRLSLFFIGLFALKESVTALDEACGSAASFAEIEAVEMAEAEALKTELLQVKVSSSATFEEDEVSSFIGHEQASVVIDDMAAFPTMLVQTDLELTPTESVV